jgi:hypothetical protein
MTDGVGRAPTGTAITYSPSTASYRVTGDQAEFARLGITTAFLADFGSANRVAAESNANFTVNRTIIEGTPVRRQVTGRLFNPGAGNTRLPLTYTSFVDILVQEVDASGQQIGPRSYSRMWLPFGVVTPTAGQPTTGTATYNGVAFAQGVTPTNFNVEASGTSQMVANFSNNSFTASVTLTDVASGTAFAPFNFGGFIATNGFSGNGNSGNIGQWAGRFFGPAANEFGAVFDATRDDANGRTTFSGVAVGRQD